MRANTRPGTMSYAVDAPPLDWSDCDWKVVQRNAPGAITARRASLDHLPVAVAPVERRSIDRVRHVPGLVFALILAFLTAWSYGELSNLYPSAGAGSSYY